MLTPVHEYCPYCNEPIELLVDTSAGDQQYIEDCSVCCRPIDVVIHVVDEHSVEVQLRDENAC